MISTRITLVHSCIIFCVVGFAVGTSIEANLKLELVQVLFRHGARTPLKIQAAILSEHNETIYEPWGFAQLTKQGMIQEYGIGKMLRKRYDGFLSDNYKLEELYAYSSNTERTIESLQLVLAALYPPVVEQKWHDNLTWIPIPIHTIPRSLDNLLISVLCPKYIEELAEVYNAHDVKFSHHSSVCRKISGILGKPMDFEMVFGLYHLFQIHKSFKIPPPEWCTEEILKEMEETGEFHLDILSYTNTLKRLNGGPLVRRFLENVVSSNTNEKKKKMYLYSAHEVNLHAYLRSHNLTAFRTPGYGSAILMEKYRSIHNKYYIKLLYWTGEPKQMHILKLEKCSELCPLEKYSEIVQPTLPSDDEMLCLLKNLEVNDLDKILKTDFVK